MEDKTLRYTLFVLASVVGIWKGRNENRCFCVRFCFSFYCPYAGRQDVLLRFLSLLSFACCVLCAVLLLIGSNIILS